MLLVVKWGCAAITNDTHGKPPVHEFRRRSMQKAMPSRWKSRLAVLALFIVLVGIYAGYVRPWHARWGATADEQRMALPGDALAINPAAVTTRAVTIDAPPEVVWQWLVQIGQGRGGWYSYDWMENLFAADMHNAAAIEPALQTLAVGDPILFTQMGLHATVAAIMPQQALVLDGGWTFYLEPVGERSTRLIVRYFCKDNPIYYYTIFEPAHFLMESGMMLGIKDRAEGTL
jgi:hypothetical protein